MSPKNRDLTIESALADPMIQALMSADRVKPRAFEALLRGAARKIGSDLSRVPPSRLPPSDDPRRSGACFA
jgi:hypothetical protein